MALEPPSDAVIEWLITLLHRRAGALNSVQPDGSDKKNFTKRLTEICARAANFRATSDHVATLWIELLAAADASLFPGANNSRSDRYRDSR